MYPFFPLIFLRSQDPFLYLFYSLIKLDSAVYVPVPGVFISRIPSVWD